MGWKQDRNGLYLPASVVEGQGVPLASNRSGVDGIVRPRAGRVNFWVPPGQMGQASGGGLTRVAAGTVASIVSASRDVGSAAGGASITYTVTGLVGTPVFTFQGTAGTTTATTSNTVTVTVPAGTVGVCDVVCGSVKLTNGFEYLPGLTQYFVQDAFDSQSLAGWSDEGTTNLSFVSSPVAAGHSYALQCLTSSSIFQASATHKLANNAALTTHNPNGVWARVKVAIDQTEIDNTWASGQTKFHLARYLDNGSGQNGFFMTGWGSSFSPNLQAGDFALCQDAGIVTLPGSHAGTFVANTFVEVQMYMIRDPSAHLGSIRAWINGKNQVPLFTSANIGNDTDTAIDKLYIRFGNAFTSYANAGTGHIYLNEAAVADGYIEGN